MSSLTNSTVSHYIDVRSDTVTKPTASMRQAMFEAEVGDDVYGDDPTVLKLQSMAAKLLGKEAALFVPSGTMGNLISVLTHCNMFGSEMILGDQSHIYFYEQGGSATLGRVHSRVVQTQPDGTLLLSDIEKVIRPFPANDDHFPITKLICLENTHNRMGGKILSVEYTNSIGELCKKHGIKLHMDGARLMNAAVELNIEPSKLVESCDSVSFCLSKALAAPVGSIIAGTVDFIKQAKRLRKVLGGGLRQSGILAAAGILSITEMPKLLKNDHENAKILAVGLAKIDGIDITASEVQTNIVVINLNSDKLSIDAPTLASKLKANHKILISASEITRIRFVIHYMITTENIEFILRQIQHELDQYRK
ncbi:unnamed protein product [Didymodactylos carnosus]|uniref:Aromatic amino acid beta-eliminating lyase/threonine aldolase domain-containing protein n=1 Tax=Didymodactylos carnosus TaxID=1234261 RepID=A0A815LZK5_9BILA|nr:unnamed protein product [Didymodactylos carnosus]CAF1417588.1 unnamed protein product [Didymodactylos carnosus]CAF3740810.1 unnamed protein product [Didymodactylos carnosus]CAF4302538.1 unnamed protein product [Didymodactylos carnosus]